jgi:NADH-ubiquinone oxidoreductase chain 5
MYLSVVILPLISSCLSGLFGSFFGSFGARVLTTSLSFVTFLVSCFIFFEVAICNINCYLPILSWVHLEYLNFDWTFQFDPLTAVMLLVVTSISFLVHLYSCEYMAHDPHIPRFMAYLSLFTFFMLILVTADNFVQMFVGWEGVGLCSYLLINFWFTRIQANKAAIKAMVMNRIGDFALVLAIIILYQNFGVLEYSLVFSLAPYFQFITYWFLNIEFNILDLICILLFIGAVGKSAQLGLHTWLPDAMEGPTPVSALIHAATMVTAGVFLIARCSPIFEYSPNVLIIITVVGACTAFYAASIGLVQNDIKRVIAYSTCSQLGYMIFACGLSNYHMAVFHLFNHAFFKALLFLCAGSIIHALGDEQDMRKYGGLGRLLPFTYKMMLIGSLSLMGMPYLTGFYSKDAILEIAFGSYSTHGFFAFVLGSCAAFFTAFYSIRLICLTFLVKPNGFRISISHAHEPSWCMSIPLALLSIPSILIGFFCKDMFIGLGTNFWNDSIFIHPNNLIVFDSELIPTVVKLLPLGLSFLGACCAYFFYLFDFEYIFNFKMSSLGLKLYNFLNKKWFFDKVYNSFVGQYVLFLSYFVTYITIDRGLLEHFGPYGLFIICDRISSRLNFFQSGYFYHYTLYMVIFLIFTLPILCTSFFDPIIIFLMIFTFIILLFF